MKKRYNIYLDQTNVDDLRYIYPDFNLSDFVDKCIRDFLFDGEEVINPVHLKAREIAKRRMKERAAQQRIIEESRLYEEKAREMMRRDEEIFLKIAKKEIPFPDGYIDFLPGQADESEEFWQKKAAVMSSLCQFHVQPGRVIKYVKEVTNVP